MTDFDYGHHLRIDITIEDPFCPGHPGYQPVCDECGDLGEPQSNPTSAHRVLNVHARFIATSS